MNTVAIVVAAGEGRRMGRAHKAVLELDGRALLCYSLDLLQRANLIDGICVAVHPAFLEYFRGEFSSGSSYSKVFAWVAGGARRGDSVEAGLAAVPASVSLVAVHDAARPFISEPLLKRVVEAAKAAGAAVPGVEISDTIKEIDGSGFAVATLERSKLRAIQTPQVFSASLLRDAYRNARKKGIEATDDAALVEGLGHPVLVVEGERDNIKITMPEDVERAREILRNSKSQIPNPKQIPKSKFKIQKMDGGGRNLS